MNIKKYEWLIYIVTVILCLGVVALIQSFGVINLVVVGVILFIEFLCINLLFIPREEDPLKGIDDSKFFNDDGFISDEFKKLPIKMQDLYLITLFEGVYFQGGFYELLTHFDENLIALMPKSLKKIDLNLTANSVNMSLNFLKELKPKNEKEMDEKSELLRRKVDNLPADSDELIKQKIQKFILSLNKN